MIDTTRCCLVYFVCLVYLLRLLLSFTEGMVVGWISVVSLEQQKCRTTGESFESFGRGEQYVWV